MKKFTSLSIALALLIIVLSISPAFSATEKLPVTEPLQETYDNDLNKLHFYFGLENAEDKSGSATARTLSNKVSVDDDYFTYIDTETELDSAIENMNTYCEKYADDESIQVTVEFKSDFEKTDEYLEFQEKKRNINSVEELRALRESFNKFSKEYHESINTTNIKRLSSIQYDSLSSIDYSPFIVMNIKETNITSEKLIGLAEQTYISNISLSFEEEYINETTWNRVLRETDLYSTVSSGLYTGDGVNVGVFELGICDTNNSNLSNMNIYIDPNCNTNTNADVDAHATEVTSIISIIAPDSNIYFSNNHSNGLSWFIEQNCDVVNCSFGLRCTIENGNIYTFDYDNAVYRYDEDGLYDYQIKANSINVVKSAGNVNTNNTHPGYNPDGYVTSPGLAHNVITVGGLDCTLNLLSYKLEHSPYSCYVTADNSAKPEFSAIFSVQIPGIGTKDGTSYAAPQVTGALALLFEEHPAFATSSTDAKAMLIASAKKTESYSNISNSYFDDKVGAGCLYYKNGLRDCEHIFYSWRRQATSVPNGNTTQRSISLSQNDELQVGLAWSAEFNNSCYITNYDLKIYDPNGNLVCSSTLNANNSVELVRYTVPSTGTYTVAVYQNGIMPIQIANDYISLVCNIV